MEMQLENPTKDMLVSNPSSHEEISKIIIAHHPSDFKTSNYGVLKKLMKKKLAAKIYTCSFCNRQYGSPQAIGGHHNAHRHIVFSKIMKGPIEASGQKPEGADVEHGEGAAAGGSSSNPTTNIISNDMIVTHASPFPIRMLPKHLLLPVDDQFPVGEPISTATPAAAAAISLIDYGNTNNSVLDSSNTSSGVDYLMNVFPSKELSLADRVGMMPAAEDAKGKACIGAFDLFGGKGVTSQKLDLTLKL